MRRKSGRGEGGKGGKGGEGLDLDAGMRLQCGHDSFQRGVEFGNAWLGQQVHEVQAGEDGLIFGIGNDKFVVKVNRFGLGDVPLERVHIPNFKT
jgi:hypothetical protein